MNISTILRACLDGEKMSSLIKRIENHDVSIDRSFNPGELKDKLADLTSEYSFFAALNSKCEWVVACVGELIEQESARARNKVRAECQSEKIPAHLLDDKIRFVNIVTNELLGVDISEIKTIQDLKQLKLTSAYLRDYIKSVQSAIDRSLDTGRTVLSFSKEELKGLGVS